MFLWLSLDLSNLKLNLLLVLTLSLMAISPILSSRYASRWLQFWSMSRGFISKPLFQDPHAAIAPAGSSCLSTPSPTAKKTGCQVSGCDALFDMCDRVDKHGLLPVCPPLALLPDITRELAPLGRVTRFAITSSHLITNGSPSPSLRPFLVSPLMMWLSSSNPWSNSYLLLVSRLLPQTL